VIEHRRHILVRVAPISLREHPVSGPNAASPGGASDDLLGIGHGARFHARWRTELAPLPRSHQVEQAAAADQLGGQFVLAARELLDRNRFARSDAVDEAEVGGRVDAEVAAVLPVDALEALGDHEPDSSAPLGVGARLARGALAVAPPGDCHSKAARLDAASLDRQRFAALQPEVGVLAELLVEVVANVSRRDLVSGDVGAQRQRLLARHVLAAQLSLDDGCVLRQEQDAAIEPQGTVGSA
jgi:hypothetical protein